MDFDDRAALDAGLASDAMRQAGRNLREIAPGLSTLLVVEDDRRAPDAAGPDRIAPYPSRPPAATVARTEGPC